MIFAVSSQRESQHAAAAMKHLHLLALELHPKHSASGMFVSFITTP